MIANVLSIAGSDPSGGAGIQADLKTFAALGCYGMAAITALTAQNTRGVDGFVAVDAQFVAQQIDTVFADIDVAAVKVGMIATAAIAGAVAACLVRHRPRFVVLDPVLAASSGDALGEDDVAAAVLDKLFPLADLVTPNMPEAARLAGIGTPEDTPALGRMLLARGGRAVLIKGGHAGGESSDDLLVTHTGMRLFSGPRIATQNTHGTGCTLSSAIAAFVARGYDLPEAVGAAKAFLTDALRHAHELRVGHGHGPLHHGFAQR